MAHSRDTRDAVRAAYIHERLPLEEASKRCNVKHQTARNWKREAKATGDDWDKARSAARLAAGGLGDLTTQIVEDFAVLFQGTIERLKVDECPALERAEAIARLSDAYTKVMKAASTGSAKVSELSVALKVLNELAGFIKAEFPDDMLRFVAILEAFGPRINAFLK